MSTYKVLQDIEAEDKLVGPLSLRQFIYAGVAAVCLYICFLAYTRGVPFLIAIFLPVALICTFFGFPWKGEQPTEIWALARLRFMVKPRIRIWNQSGIKDYVTITVPRNMPVKYQTRNLSQYEVRSRLKALADTIDSRGWATRNANYRYYTNQQRPQSDRLVNASDLQPGSIPMDVFLPSNDMLDDQGSVAQNLDALLNKSSVAQRQRVIQEISGSSQVPAAVLATMQEPGSQTPQMQAMPPQPQMQATQPMQALPQLPAPVMPPTQPMQQTQPAQPTANPYQQQYTPPPQYPMGPQQPPIGANNYWFVNSPANNPYQPQQMQQPMPEPMPAVPVAAMPPMPALPTSSVGGPVGVPSLMPAGIAPIAPADPTASEQAFAATLSNRQDTMQVNYGHMRVLQTPGGPVANTGAPAQTAAAPGQAESVTPPPDPAILELANNNDLDVATIARQVHKEHNKSSGSSGEVEVRLR